MSAPPREAVQKQIQQDWVNREYIEVITVSINKIAVFLNSFDLSCRSKLAVLNEKLTTLERKIDYLEACVSLASLQNIVNKNSNYSVDEERRKQFGPDRVCAEWLLKNGAMVKFVGQSKYLADYNSLPIEGIKFYIQEVDATDSSIMHYGFDHFKGCQHIKKIIMDKCISIEDEALHMLTPINSSLNDLQVSNCLNITEDGLKGLKPLVNLNNLILFNLNVKNPASIVDELKKSLPKCKIEYKD